MKYTINVDLTVDVDNDVYIKNEELTKIPVKFNKVDGDFSCGKNKLTSLENCPNNIHGSFYCYENKLTSLEGCPPVVIGNFSCKDNYLTSLKGCPSIVKHSFYCDGNNLQDINDLDSKIMIKNVDSIYVSRETWDKYFEYWIDKDFSIFNVLKYRINDEMKQKYNYLFQEKNFDLL